MSSDVHAAAQTLRELRKQFKKRDGSSTLDDLMTRTETLHVWIDDMQKVAGSGKMGSGNRYGQLPRLQMQVKQLAEDMSVAYNTSKDADDSSNPYVQVFDDNTSNNENDVFAVVSALQDDVLALNMGCLSRVCVCVWRGENRPTTS